MATVFSPLVFMLPDSQHYNSLQTYHFVWKIINLQQWVDHVRHGHILCVDLTLFLNRLWAVVPVFHCASNSSALLDLVLMITWMETIRLMHYLQKYICFCTSWELIRTKKINQFEVRWQSLFIRLIRTKPLSKKPTFKSLKFILAWIQNESYSEVKKILRWK